MSSNKRKFCEHCQDYVSSRTYRQHLDLYFNKESGQWYRHESSDEESGHISNSVSDLDGNDTASETEGCPNVTPLDTENFDENGVPEAGI